MSENKVTGVHKELGAGLPPEAINPDIDLAFMSECVAPPSAIHPVIETARWELRLPMKDVDIQAALGNTINVWGTPNGQPPTGVAAATNTLGTPGQLPGPHIIFGWRIRFLTEAETRRIPGNQYTPPLGSVFLPGSPDVYTQNDLLRALGVPVGGIYLPGEFLFGLPTWRASYALQQSYQANWFVNHEEQIWKQPLTQCSVVEPFSQAEAAGLAFTTNQDTILDLNRQLVNLGITSQFLPEKFTRSGSLTDPAGFNFGIFNPSRSSDASSSIFGGIGVPSDYLQKKPYIYSSPIFWPRGQPIQFLLEVNGNTIYQKEMQRWLSVTGGSGGTPGLDQALPFSDILSGLMPTAITTADTMQEQTDDPVPVPAGQQVPTTVSLEKGGKMIIEIGLIAKRVPPAWYQAVGNAIAMKAVICPEGAGDLETYVLKAKAAMAAR
jgi:hypothetical protein